VNSEPKKTVLTQWVRAWNQQLLRFLSRRGASRQEAEDFVQEVYLRVLRMDDLDLVNSPQAYLFKIAKNLLSEWKMRAAQTHPHTADGLKILVADENPEAELEQRDEQRFIRQALDGLPLVTRQVLLLHIQEDMSYDEVSKHLDMTRRSVKRHVLAGYSGLRHRLGGLRLELPAKDDSP